MDRPGRGCCVTGVKIGELLEGAQHRPASLRLPHRKCDYQWVQLRLQQNRQCRRFPQQPARKSLRRRRQRLRSQFHGRSLRLRPFQLFIERHATGPCPTRSVPLENSSSATAPAQQVTITQQLDPNLDWSTFQLSGIGFGDNFIDIPAGSQHYQTTVPMTLNGVTFDVEVEAGIHTDTGQVYATFQSIDPGTQLPPANPLIGFLPPEDGTGRGDTVGVSYSVRPKGQSSPPARRFTSGRQCGLRYQQLHHHRSSRR